MTLYIAFAGFGMLIYMGVAYAEAAISGLGSAPVGFGAQVAFFVALLLLLALDILFNAIALVRNRPRAAMASAWRRRIVVIALVFFAGSVAILIAATGESGVPLTCTGQCGTGHEPIPAEAGAALASGVHAAVGIESARAAGKALFQERGCVSCHRPDDVSGAGPTLQGLFGSAVQDPACGVAFVDDSYLREAILNPLATVAAGFAPVMPTFAGLLTDEELQALIEYVKSLRIN